MYTVAVAHNNPFLHQIPIDAIRIRHTDEDEVGISGVNLLADGQETQRLDECHTLLQYHGDVALQQGHVTQYLQSFLLGENIHVLRIFHLIEQSNDVGAGKCHTQTDACCSPRF